MLEGQLLDLWLHAIKIADVVINDHAGIIPAKDEPDTIQGLLAFTFADYSAILERQRPLVDQINHLLRIEYQRRMTWPYLYLKQQAAC